MVKLTDTQILECLESKDNNTINKCLEYLSGKYGCSCSIERLKSLIDLRGIDISYFSGKVKYKKEELLPKVLLHYKESRNCEDLLRKCGFESKTQAGRLVKKIIKDLSLDVSHWSRKFSKETREKISSKRKEFLKNNPDKHPWKRSTKFQSVPCDRLKGFLEKHNILFIEEFTPKIDDKNYSIDIAFPDKKIGLEVNGNQHYERTGELKPYYKNRHVLIESKGWKLYEIHYSSCFNEDVIIPMIKQILESPEKEEFDYLTYVPKDKIEFKCSICLGYVCQSSKSGLCKNCSWHGKPRVKFDELKRAICIKSIRKTSKSGVRRECSSKNKAEMASPTRSCSMCGDLTFNKKYCSYLCSSLSSRKVKHPTKEELEKLVWEKPTTELSKQFGVSDVAISKWCKRYGIQKPKRGHWEKVHHGKLPLTKFQTTVNL